MVVVNLPFSPRTACRVGKFAAPNRNVASRAQRGEPARQGAIPTNANASSRLPAHHPPLTSTPHASVEQNRQSGHYAARRVSTDPSQYNALRFERLKANTRCHSPPRRKRAPCARRRAELTGICDQVMSSSPSPGIVTRRYICVCFPHPPLETLHAHLLASPQLGASNPTFEAAGSFSPRLLVRIYRLR